MVLLEMICSKDNQMIINKVNMLVNKYLRESENKYLEEFIHLPVLKNVIAFMQHLPIEEAIDPILKGKIAPMCWQVFVDIIARCLKYEPDERPTMGEVEMLLEYALSLQEEANIRMTNSDYTLLSTNIINRGQPYV